MFSLQRLVGLPSVGLRTINMSRSSQALPEGVGLGVNLARQIGQYIFLP